MTHQTITVHLPDILYHQIEERARRKHRSIEDELVAVVATALPTLEDIPSAITDEMDQLDYLTDKELYQVVETTLSSDEAAQMQALLLKRQREGLSAEEEAEAEGLLQRYDRMMLVRAKAIALLKKRGYDVSNFVATASEQ